MVQFVKDHIKLLGISLFTTLGLFFMMSRAGVLLFPMDGTSQTFTIINHIIIYGLIWVLLFVMVRKYSILKIAGILSILIISVAAENYLDFTKNPFSIPLIILFFIAVTSLIAPHFFKKYKYVILAIYSFVILYYIYYFKTSNDLINHRLSFSKYVIIPIPFFIVLWIYEQWRWLQTLKVDKAKAELALLKSQVNPHFFFNTLNNLYGLVMEKSDQAPEVILKLSDMMRYTIYNGKEDHVSLKDEVGYLENYIELHKIRYHKAVDIRFKKSLNQEVKVAPLLFIILLENAFKHGVEKLTQNAYIYIDISSQMNTILFSIENNFEENTAKGHKGIGLENLHQRLELLYPNQHTLTFSKNQSTYTNMLLNHQISVSLPKMRIG